MKQTYPPIVFLTSATETSAFLAADVALSTPQRTGTCELIMTSENIFSEVFQRLDDKEFSDRLFIFHWIGDSNDSTFIEQLIRRLSVMPNFACLILEDILIPPSATIAHLLPITIAVSKNQDKEDDNIFSSHFYEQIAQNSSIKEAYNYASKKLPNTPSVMFVKPSAEYTLDFTLLETKKRQEIPQTPQTPEQEKIERFKKIIQQKARFSTFSKPELLLSKQEIQLFEEYRFELAPLSDIETQFYYRSLKIQNQKRRQQRYLYRAIFFLSFFLVLMGLGVWLQYQEYERQAESHKTQTHQQQANFLTYLGDNLQKENATKAIRLIEKAVREYPTISAQGSLYSHFYSSNLYYSAQIPLKNANQEKVNYAVSSDGQWLAYFDNQNETKTGNKKEKNAIFISSLQGDVIKKIEKDVEIEKIVFSNNFPYRLAVGFADGKVEILDVYGKSLLEMQAHNTTISGLSFSKDDTKIISAADTLALIWTTTGEILDTISGNRSQILKMRFSPNQKNLFTEAKDSVIAVWEGSQLISTFEGTKAKWLSDTYLVLQNRKKQNVKSNKIDSKTDSKIENKEDLSDSDSSKWIIWNISTNKIKKQLQNLKQILIQDSISFWVIDKENTLKRHYFESDSVTLWQRNVAYFAMYKGQNNQKWVIISQDGLCTMRFADGSEATTKLDNLPIKEPYFTQDGNYLVIQTVDNITFWRAVSPQLRFADKEEGQKWITQNTSLTTAKRDVKLISISENVYYLLDQNATKKAEFKADKAILHASQNYILTLKKGVISLDKFDKTFRITNISTKNINYYTAGFSQTGNFIWLITQLNELQLLNLQGKIFYRQIVKPNTEVICSPNDKQLAFAQNITGGVKPYRILHLDTKQNYELDTRLERSNISTFFFSPSQNGQNEYLVSASENWTDFWDLKGRRMKALKGGNPIYGKEMILTSSKDNFYIATLDANKVYHKELKNLQKASLTEDKNYIVLEFEKSLQVWKTSPFGIIQWLEENKIYQLSTQEQKQLLLR